MDYLALSKMLATTIRSNMMQFSQAITPMGGGGEPRATKQPLPLEKGSTKIGKLKDACGVRNAQQTPAFWSVIQSIKGMSFDTYHIHITKSINLWCRSHHIDRDKSIFLEAKFFEALVALFFNPGGAVAQFYSVVRGMLILMCRSLMAVEAEFCWGYEEAAADMEETPSIKDLLKVIAASQCNPRRTIWN